MPPVSGLLQPTEIRPLVEAAEPVSRPGANTSLFAALRGWQRGSTSLLTTIEVMARPPRPAYCPTGSTVVAGPPSAPMSMRRILSMPAPASFDRRLPPPDRVSTPGGALGGPDGPGTRGFDAVPIGTFCGITLPSTESRTTVAGSAQPAAGTFCGGSLSAPPGGQTPLSQESIAKADRLPSPMARITVAAPRTMSPPAKTPGMLVMPYSSASRYPYSLTV